MKNKRKWGGIRKGSGRPKTGRTTTHLNVCVPIEYKSLLQDLVKAKVKELKDAQKGLKAASAQPVTVTLKRPEKMPPSYTLHGKDVTSIKKKKDGSVKITAPANKLESNYLQERRKAKQGLK